MPSWSIKDEYAHPKKGAALEIDFEAKEVFLVMRPIAEEARVRVLIDGTEQHFGKDVREGKVVVDSDRLYRLIDIQEPGRHRLRLEFLDDNAELYAFTFG